HEYDAAARHSGMRRSLKQIEGLRFHLHERARQTGDSTIDLRPGLSLDVVAQTLHPGLDVRSEEAALPLEVAHLHVIACDEVTHHLEEIRDVILGIAAGF